MKIGIVTVEKSANVGSFLQAYALQRKAFLKENIAGLYLREEI